MKYYELKLKDGTKEKMESEEFHNWVRERNERISPIVSERLAQINNFRLEVVCHCTRSNPAVDWSLEDE
jgi:hypothetical protein